MLADYHIHTEYSDDSVEQMEVIIKNAIEKNISEICFTDHVDYGIKIDHDIFKQMSDDEKQKFEKVLNVDYPNYFKEIETLKNKYKNQITIKQGLEFGIQTHTVKKFQQLFDSYDLDFIILSCHQANDKEFWNYNYQNGKTEDEYNLGYYEEIYKCIHLYHDYSILGHLDLIQRYNKTIYPFEKSRDIITKILKKVIEDGKGIEVNTSSFAYKLKDLTPSKEILKLYYELGGKIITIGSDSHKAESIGSHIPLIQQELKNIGFSHFCTFDKMEPVFHEL
ncbi:MAG: histidinol-phosphatase HisJ family protein [Sebaldella sp.]|nr:histidinol-phosphatase HisJ family protein [Sebaldella sp.]